MPRITLVTCALLCWALPAAAQTTIPVDVFAAYLHIDPADIASNAQPIDLAGLGLAPGYTIRLEPSGDWDAGPGEDVQTNMLGVFSGNATLLAPHLPHRVPGAIPASISDFTGGTWPGGQPTDIPEDFLISGPGVPNVTLQIPPGATHLFVTPADIYYRDNGDPDGDFGVKITLISTTSVAGGGPGATELSLSTHPNPFAAETAIAFRLQRSESVRLTIHDVGGRLLRTLLAETLPLGSHLARWNGRDDSGRRVPAGSYFARLERAGRMAATRVVLVR
jgi:hypothetical protein